MSEISKASADALEAARQGEQFAIILAAVQAAQTVQPSQATAPPAPQRQAVEQAGKWLAIAVGGSMLMVTVAFAAVALAIAAVSIALVAVVVYGIYRDIRKR
ncbi:hypothetical protein [Streptomyces sp. NPDC008139]|uniref:hypothetical protein n=1 Tax=Streptomyces sp. NPDC008139 TaxID=3364814 RepID=UPI0036EC52D4